MRPAKPFGQGGELWDASNQGYTPEGGVDQWPGTTTPDPGGVPEPIWNAPATSGFAPGEWDQVPGGFGQDPKDGGGFQEPGWNPNAPVVRPQDGGGVLQEPGWNPNAPQTPLEEHSWPTGGGNPPPQDGGGFQQGMEGDYYNVAPQASFLSQPVGQVDPRVAELRLNDNAAPQDGGGFQDVMPEWMKAGLEPPVMSTSAPPTPGRPEDPFTTDPAQQFQNYQDAMTVPVGEDPLSQSTNQTLQNLVNSGQGQMGNQAQGVIGGLLGNMGELDDPYNPYAHKARTAIAGMIDEQGGSPAAIRTHLGQNVQSQLGSTIAQGGELPAHQMVQQAQTQLQDLMAQGQTRQLQPWEQKMATQLSTVIDSGGQVEQSGLAQTSEQALQDIIQQGGMPQQSDVGAQTGQQISDLLANQGRLPEDLQREAMQIEAARSPLDAMRRAQTAQGAAALADRGLVGSGAGREYLEGLEGRLAPQYTQAAQQIEEQRRQADDQRYSQALGLGAQRGGQLESLQQQGMQSALGQAGQQTAQQEQLEQSERQQAMGQAGQYGLGLGQQGQEQQQFGISQATQLGTQQDQMRDARYSQAMEQAGQLSSQDVAQRQERYLQSVMAGEGIGRDEAMRRDQRLQSSIQQATGLDGQRIQNLLSTAQTVGERQELIGGMAMDALENNQNWNRFMAEHGLNRQAVMEGLRQGRAGIVMNMMELYQQSVRDIHGGYNEFQI